MSLFSSISQRFLVSKLLKQLGLKMDDIRLWELNKAFAVQVIYCSDFLGIPDDILNVNSGSISISHPYGV
tara:strand:+ start:350 stop:559 length:210 start_codon:yes stop_codon:yes gene_type:complete